MRNIFLKMEIETIQALITIQENELKIIKDDWTKGFHEGLKKAYERSLEGLKQIQREEESRELQRAGA